MSLDRRTFLRRATGLAALSAVPGPLIGLTSCAIRGAVRRAGPGEGGYGELTPSRDYPELALPPDFQVNGPAPVVVGGMVFVSSGDYRGRPGNVLLALSAR